MCRNSSEQGHVIRDLQASAHDQRQGRKRPREHEAGNRGADGRSEAPGHRGHARRRGALDRRDHGHDIGRSGRHIHLRQSRPDQQESEHDGQVRRERDRDQAEARWNVGEHHGVDEPDASGEPRRNRETTSRSTGWRRRRRRLRRRATNRTAETAIEPAATERRSRQQRRRG